MLSNYTSRIGNVNIISVLVWKSIHCLKWSCRNKITKHRLQKPNLVFLNQSNQFQFHPYIIAKLNTVMQLSHCILWDNMIYTTRSARCISHFMHLGYASVHKIGLLPHIQGVPKSIWFLNGCYSRQEASSDMNFTRLR